MSSARTGLSSYTIRAWGGGRGGSLVLNAAARGWQNRNKRLTGNWGHVPKLRLGEWWYWWWEGQGTQAAFFFNSLSGSVWSSEGTVAVQCREAHRRIHTDKLLNSGEWMWHRLACYRAIWEWKGEITCNNSELQVRRKNVYADDTRHNKLEL